MRSVVITLLALLSGSTIAFQPAVRSLEQHTTTRTNTRLFGVIEAESIDFDFDIGQGGVRLAEESAIKLSGSIKHGPGFATARTDELLRYKTLTSVSETLVNYVLKDVTKGSIVCTGRGREQYKDPGETTEKQVNFAPSDAVRDALMGAGSAINAHKFVINFLGGSDLQVAEVLQAAEQLVMSMDVGTKEKVLFHSVSDSSLPSEVVTVTAVILPEESLAGGMEGPDKSIALGEVYFYDGKYYTTVESEINTALA